MLNKNSLILFQGDSITDTGRTGSADPDASLGQGYPAKIAEAFANDYADLGLTVVNRGISGNRTWDLLNRWDKDCIDIKPDYFSLLIGVNDTWRRYDSGMITTAEEYEANMRTLLDRVVKETGAKIILLNIFLLDVTEDKAQMRPDLVEKQAVIAKLVEDYDVIYIDIQKKFDEMVANGTPMTDLSDVALFHILFC